MSNFNKSNQNKEAHAALRGLLETISEDPNTPEDDRLGIKITIHAGDLLLDIQKYTKACSMVLRDEDTTEDITKLRREVVEYIELMECGFKTFVGQHPIPDKLAERYREVERMAERYGETERK